MPMRTSNGRLRALAGTLPRALLGASFVLAPRAASGEPPPVEAGLPRYAAVRGIAGNLSAVGSDTLNNLMTLWAEGFRRRYPSRWRGRDRRRHPPRSSRGPPSSVP